MLSSAAFLPDALQKYAELHQEQIAKQQPYFEEVTTALSKMIRQVTNCSQFPINIINDMPLLWAIEQAGITNVKEWLEARHYTVDYSTCSNILEDRVNDKLIRFIVNLPYRQ